MSQKISNFKTFSWELKLKCVKFLFRCQKKIGQLWNLSPFFESLKVECTVLSIHSTHLTCRFRLTIKLAIHLSFLVFRHVRALFRKLFREIALYTSHNIADFVHLWFCEKLVLSSSLTFCENTDRLVRMAKREMRKMMAKWFTKCHLYTSRFSSFTKIFSHSRQFDDKCSWL